MKTTAYVCALLALVGLSTPSFAQANSWISPTRGYWDDYSKWSLGIAPTNDQTVYITNDISKTVTIDDFTSGTYPETLTVSNVTLSATAGVTNSLELVDAGTNTPLRILDTFTVSSGGLLHLTASAISTRSLTNSITNFFFSVDGTAVLDGNSVLVADSGLFVGVDTNANGSVLLNDAQLVLTNIGVSAIGVNGIGHMIVSNSQFQAASGFIFVGSGSGSQGTLVMAKGNCTFSPYSRLVIGMENGSTGLVSVSEGNFVMTNSFITLVGSSGHGQFKLLGGTNILGPMEVGADTGSRGTLTVTGGKTTLQHALLIGAGSGSTGSMWMTGGQIVQTNFYRVSSYNYTNGVYGSTNRWPTYVGEWGSGQLTLSNGNWLGAGMIVGAESNSQGAASFAGSTTTLLTNLVVGSHSNSTGIVNLTNSSLSVSQAGIYVGDSGTGQVTALKSSVFAMDVMVGNGLGSRGNLLLDKSSSLVASGVVSIGESGFGQMKVLASSMQATNLVLADGPNSYGEIVFNSNSTVIADGGIFIGGGSNATGYFWFNNSTVGAVSNYPAAFGVGIAGFGQAVVSNSTFRSSGSAIVGSGNGSQGALSIVNGSYVLAPYSRLLIGMDSGATGTVSFSNANLVMTNCFITEVGGSGSGQLTLPGGANTLGAVEVGGNPGSAGTFTISGGVNTLETALSVGTSLNSTGTVWVTGGQLITTNLTTCIGSWGNGAVTISNGFWLGSATSLGLYSNAVGTINLGGMATFLSKLVIGNCPSGGVGVVNVSGILCVTNAAHNAFIDVRKGQLNLNGGTLVVDTLILTNPCGLFVRSGGTLIVGTLVLDPNLDADGDSIPNGWEQAHGLDPLDSSDANVDSDGDGFSNLQEYLAGTDPFDSTSAFRITSIEQSIQPVGTGFQITWSASTGKTYIVQVCTNLLGGSFTNLATVSVPISPPISETNYWDTVNDEKLRFYKIKLVTP